MIGEAFKLSRNQGIGLSVGLVGALIASQVGLPLPWMLGSMLAVTLAALARAPVAPPIGLRRLMVPVLGVLLGSGFSPSVVGQLGEWLVTLAILPLFALLAFAGSFFFYRRIGAYDRVTAYFSAAPGGLNDMMIIGAEAGGDEKRIALAHASRIFIVVTFVAFFYNFALSVETSGDARPYVQFSDVPIPDLGLLTACAIVGALVGPKLGLPAPQILGPMILSALVHLTGLTDAPPPSLAVNAAQLVMGTVVGSRFAGTPAIEILRDLLLALGSSSLMLVVALGTAVAVATLTPVTLDQSFLAFSPGGLPEMSLLALAMGADVAYVATIHIVRITLVISLAPIAFRILRDD